MEITNTAGRSLTPQPMLAKLMATRFTNVSPTADDFELTCIPDTITAHVGDDPVDVVCTFSGKDSLGDKTVTLTHLLMTSPEGWGMSGAGTVDGSTLTLTPKESIGAGGAYTFGFFASPAVCGAGSGLISLSSFFTFEESDPMGGPGAMLTADVGSGLVIAPGIDAAALDFGTSVKVESGYTPVTGTLAVTLLPPGDMTCAALSPEWSIQISTNGLYQDRTSARIPAESFTYLGTQSVLDAPGGLIPLGGDIPLASGAATTIASGNETIGEGGAWNAMFQLSPPSDVPPGAYGGTIEIMIVAAP